VPLAEVVRFTGRSQIELLDLVRAGVLEEVPSRGTCELSIEPARVDDCMCLSLATFEVASPGCASVDSRSERPERAFVASNISGQPSDG
jgi:hypothetical protein